MGRDADRLLLLVAPLSLNGEATSSLLGRRVGLDV